MTSTNAPVILLFTSTSGDSGQCKVPHVKRTAEGLFIDLGYDGPYDEKNPDLNRWDRVIEVVYLPTHDQVAVSTRRTLTIMAAAEFDSQL